MEINTIHQYFKDRITEIKYLAERGDPWVFLCCSAFIDYLVRATFNKEAKSMDYKMFIKDYLSQINLKYKDFTYNSGKQDLPEQMYHILRCGIIHNFSLIPDTPSEKNGGRPRSIIIGHEKSGKVHLDNFISPNRDSAIFIAETFAADLEKLVDLIFTKSIESNPAIESKIKEWWSKFTPISAMSE